MAQENGQPLVDEPELKIVLIGRSRVGKSATGNTILGRKAFKSIISESSVTQECQTGLIKLDGQNVAVIDTPGLFGSTASDDLDEEMPEKVMENIKQYLLNASPSPVVFLVVTQLGRFSEPEQQSVKIIQSWFGREAAHYTMALFTRGDDLKKEGGRIDEFIGKNPALRDFIRGCYGGYHVFDNGDTDLPQVIELLRKINCVVERNGGGNVDLALDDGGVLQKVHFRGKKTKRSKALLKSCLDGAIGGACCVAVIYWRWISTSPGTVLREAAVGGVIGISAGAARYVVQALIFGG